MARQPICTTRMLLTTSWTVPSRRRGPMGSCSGRSSMAAREPALCRSFREPSMKKKHERSSPTYEPSATRSRFIELVSGGQDASANTPAKNAHFPLARYHRVGKHGHKFSRRGGAVPPLLSGSLEDRLRRLKRLWDQGLIAEEEYSAKKKELLDRCN